jgi:hypothetical protein
MHGSGGWSVSRGAHEPSLYLPVQLSNGRGVKLMHCSRTRQSTEMDPISTRQRLRVCARAHFVGLE